MLELALQVYGVVFYVGWGILIWIDWEGAGVVKKRYHLFWYLVFLPVTLSLSTCKWLYNFMIKDL